VGTSFVREGVASLANYALVYRLYRQDVAFTLGVALAGLGFTLAAGVPLCGYLRVRAFAPVEFLLKVPLFVPFVVVGHAMRVFLAPHGTLNGLLLPLGILNPDQPPSLSSSWVGLALALACLGVLLLGIIPGTMMNLAQAAARILASG